jgi:hypothetical protein
MAAGESTRSTIPVSMAARGIPSYFDDSGDCANVMPPARFTSASPTAPSLAVPDRITATLRSCTHSARDTRKASIGVWRDRSARRGERCSSAPRISICMFGGIT